MGLGRRTEPAEHPGEPGVGVDLGPPFVARDEPTRWLFSLNRFGIRPGLGRIEGLLRDLGHPERDLRTLVVAGTNGKGSTTRILTRLLAAAGLKTATYTSPHLLSVHERILVDERPVSAEDFAARVERIRPLTEKYEASWFETLTALAVQIARDERVDVLCCETGLGGRLDATNALPAAATLLTSVGLDHTHILGETREAIAAEKLGLLKRGTPFFCAVDEDLRAQAFTAAVTAGSPCHFLDELAAWDDAAGPAWDLRLRRRVIGDLPDPGTPALRRNVALSLLALDELERRGGGPLRLPGDPGDALRNLFLPGRYQRLLRAPDWILDTAHNEQALASVFSAFLAEPCAGRRRVLFGCLHDKTPSPVVAEALRTCDQVVAAPIALPRSRTVAELEDLLREWGLDRARATDTDTGCSVAPDAGAALRSLARDAGPDDRVLVTGSCFLVAEVLHRLGFDDLESSRGERPAAEVLAGLEEEVS